MDALQCGGVYLYVPIFGVRQRRKQTHCRQSSDFNRVILGSSFPLRSHIMFFKETLFWVIMLWWWSGAVLMQPAVALQSLISFSKNSAFSFSGASCVPCQAAGDRAHAVSYFSQPLNPPTQNAITVTNCKSQPHSIEQLSPDLVLFRMTCLVLVLTVISFSLLPNVNIVQLKYWFTKQCICSQ